ncbi:zinc metalloprotease HtpX [Candidatus Woesebacteria bacterium RIFCSPHIGHO2_02_FULL_42_20]|uniref:Protease HtpX homolog n=1 Tax=Candidatus Woesebacteria bacterium RIFCSPHIGHO2_12_FULL_41_24 TaxID=1802510 RepID=A0A1F8AQG9_9BACT|nr:MAG: zinc metalloprotease HtpX [Candidatus Woesebacteria bacterium RBG_16_41_13]OGM30695.1 MAG: zinc metalloprotease HtpX [Candidatus Woesebacteria bacterium RIFCSPHIGHO2_01_FULL_42_80]OGM35832.1 MAG: zinc metalloprotease HtpX [Candidatus Woesebacteria bacterium RIFCSPHIGHO2_02_FULL_42_20]OGM53890.1 MAG: zinc metalloprotease HtpX [Candidatus Woesebacteria bacterium RIFCSPHIGHO2_12_FULL_41_24]OGM66082.1 MAG: zinc metalloprotease HtpX [Candidatus Woesebacteria bacterium RIFCSPLOWO2_01_FULL_42_
MINVYEAASANKRKSVVVVFFFLVFVALAVYFIGGALGYYFGYELGGLSFFGLALILSGLMSFTGYFYSDRIVLTISGAKPADKQEFPLFYSVAQNLSLAANVSIPRLFIIEDTATNAFATGRDPDHAVICATTGLLSKLNRTELEGVIGHELTHVRNYDIRLMSIVGVLVGSIALLADILLRATYMRGRSDRRDGGGIGVLIFGIGLIFAILSPLIAQLIRLAISRQREFFADAGSVMLTRQPSGLISALKKISADHEPLEAANKATAHLYIANPFKDKIGDARNKFSSLFNTHPPMAKRIEALQQMA